jgi:hypothetical protein
MNEINNEINKEQFNQVMIKADKVNKKILLNLYTSCNLILKLCENKNITSDKELKSILSEYEKKVYRTKDGSLTDEEIIRFEFKRIDEEYKRQIEQYLSPSLDNSLDENSSVTPQQQILVLVEYYKDQIKIFNEASPNQITDEKLALIKKRIALIEGLLKLKNGLYYDTLHCFFDEYERVLNIIYKNEDFKEKSSINNFTKDKKIIYNKYQENDRKGRQQ